jgi:hypothetical protein
MNKLNKLHGGIVPLIPLLATMGSAAAQSGAFAGAVHGANALGYPTTIAGLQQMHRDPVVQHSLNNIPGLF